MDVIANSLSVLTGEWKSILGILYIFFLGSGIAYLSLKLLLRGQYVIAECLSLSLAGGLIPLFAAIGVVWLADLLFRANLNLITVLEIIFIAVGGVYIFRSVKKPGPVENQILMPVLLLLTLGISIFLRLAFISKLIVPLYFDSAEHYSIIQKLMADFQTATLPTYSSLTGGYYHLGYHLLAATVSTALDANAAEVMLIMGQILLALLPLPLFFIIRQITKSEMAAFLAVVLGGWAWSMPAHAILWGKYPALLGLLSLELVLCLAFLSLRTSTGRWILLGLVGISGLLSGFIHTRSLILIAIAFLSTILAAGWYRSSRVLRIIGLLLIVSILAGLVILVQTSPALNLMLDPYRHSGIWMTLLIILTLPFALMGYPRATFASLVSVGLLLVSPYISAAKFIPINAAQALLDRAFVEMVLFIPFAIIGGLGVGGLVKFMDKVRFLQGVRQKIAQMVILLLILGTISLNLAKDNFAPSCCLFFKQDDQAALVWMDKSIPANSVIGVASVNAELFESGPSVWQPGSDGGVWIPPLIHRSVVSLPYWTDFGAAKTLNELCQRGVAYLYVGGTQQSFSAPLLSAHPEWYEPLFHAANAQLYRIVGCGQG